MNYKIAVITILHNCYKMVIDIRQKMLLLSRYYYYATTTIQHLLKDKYFENIFFHAFCC